MKHKLATGVYVKFHVNETAIRLLQLHPRLSHVYIYPVSTLKFSAIFLPFGKREPAESRPVVQTAPNHAGQRV